MPAKIHLISQIDEEGRVVFVGATRAKENTEGW